MLKSDVRSFWDQGSAGEFWAVGSEAKLRFLTEEKSRYQFEPFIPAFADFAAAADRVVLEIGIGMGCDHQQWARARPRRLLGTDLSGRSIAYTRERFDLFNLKSDLILADCECLPLSSGCVDIVYSWGVMHHTPDTRQAVREAHRVLRPGGTAKIMIYHKWSLTGYMLWMRYGLMRWRPWWGLEYIYANFLESPGTKAYTVDEAHQLFEQFSDVRIAIQVNYGDLLQSEVGPTTPRSAAQHRKEAMASLADPQIVEAARLIPVDHRSKIEPRFVYSSCNSSKDSDRQDERTGIRFGA